MNDPDNKKSPIGLDVGTSRIVTARQAGQDFAYESQLNAFVDIPHSRITESALTKEQVPHFLAGPSIMVPGNESEQFADLLHTEVRRPMRSGILNAGEPDNLEVIRQLTTAMLGDVQGRQVCVTVPAAPLEAGDDFSYHEVALRQLLAGLGCEVTTIHEGLAVIYSELADSNYTGIGISCGGGLCNVCFAYLAVPVLSFSIPKAGDFVDSGASAVSGEPANRIRILKETSFYVNGQHPDKIQQVLGAYYDEMIRALVTGMRQAFAANRRSAKIGRPVPLVLSGGSAMPQGFRDRFEKILRESEFAMPLSEIRMAASPLTSTAKGALVAALSEI